MRLGYADPPYIGCAHLYREHPDFAGEVDHVQLVDRLQSEFDGWVLHASATAKSMAVLAVLVEKTGARWCSWRKGFAAFKRNVPVAYAWEPVIIKAARKPVVSKRLVMRDWIETEGDTLYLHDWEQVRQFLGNDVKCPITLQRGLTGAKPEPVVHWAIELMAARPEDQFSDLFPGTGAVAKAWATWRGKFTLPALEAAE